MASPFDHDYYQRFYFNRKTRVIDQTHVDKLGDFVCSYVSYLDLPVRRVLDVGCGIGLWKNVIERRFPSARYVGVEYSEYLCERYGWQKGSVVDFQARVPFDLVICQGVLPYLDDAQAKRAMRNLGVLCRGMLYVEAVTKEDFDEGVINEALTDPAMKRRPLSFYKRGLRASFEALGGGVFLQRAAQRPLYALERG
jgi:SAM-dependent methyltransferase